MCINSLAMIGWLGTTLNEVQENQMKCKFSSIYEHICTGEHAISAVPDSLKSQEGL